MPNSTAQMLPRLQGYCPASHALQAAVLLTGVVGPQSDFPTALAAHVPPAVAQFLFGFSFLDLPDPEETNSAGEASLFSQRPSAVPLLEPYSCPTSFLILKTCKHPQKSRHMRVSTTGELTSLTTCDRKPSSSVVMSRVGKMHTVLTLEYVTALQVRLAHNY